MSTSLLRERSRIVTRWDEEEDALDEALKDEPNLPVFFSDDITSRGRCGRARHAAGQRLSVMVAWLSTAAAAYWMAALVPGLAVFALTVEIDDRPGGGPYTTKALLSIARAAAMPVGFAAALYGPLRRVATGGWRRPVALALLPLIYGALPNAAFALGAVGGIGGLALQLGGRFVGSAVISLAFCAYLACAQGRRASDVAMPVATLAILLAPAVSRPLSIYVADWLGGVDDTSDNDGHLWMPLAVSVLCAAPTLAAAAALTAMPPPNQADVRARSAHVGAHECGGDGTGTQGVLLYRAPGGAVDVAAMSTGADRAWFQRHWSLVLGLAVSNAALQGLGAVRDVFTADLVGADAPWWHSVIADAPACVAACLCYVPLIWLRDNRRAFIVIGGVGLVAAVVVLSTGVASAAGWLSPLVFLISGGVGHFFALVPFSGGGIVFERLIGASHMAVDPLLVNVVCQVPAYVAALGVLLLAPAAAHPAAFFEWTAVLCGSVLVASCVWTVAAALWLLPLAAPASDDVAPLLSSLDSIRAQGDDDDDALYEARGDENDDDDGAMIRCTDHAGVATIPFFKGCSDVVVL
ncbi:hypothetical protein pmac_cds_815 [Pandoravirus macleodensis]|uniref:Uncharacterized protein n=1 Tax=Pandoravirus macleodensis TaxID=2107707 RepID=A0A2U7UG73_9VIRU|nr:hypothetical protein pmac_cds_815 [Pandoravirus macleodensis]AVK77503.1 hypothetical protein pmac_cds_815 [Pandoravirus macleodensis]